MHTSNIRNNALLDYTLTKVIVAHFVGTGGFLLVIVTVI
jgi:hypothetical protein